MKGFVCGRWMVWFPAALVSLGFHFILFTCLMIAPAWNITVKTQETGVTGAVFFDLSDIVASPSIPQEDSAGMEEAKDTPTMTESPEVVDPGKAANEPLLSRIPYDVDDHSLRFNVAGPEPTVKTEDVADEIASAFDEEKIDEAAMPGSEAASASITSVSAPETPEQAMNVQAQSEGLTLDERIELRDWQKNIVLKINRAKRYPSDARTLKITGEVRIRFGVDAHGRVLSTEIFASSGWPVLDEAALKVMRDIGIFPAPPHGLREREHHFAITLRYRFK